MITSTSNQQIKQITALLKKPKARREQDVFIVEGIRMFREVPKDHLVKAYVSEGCLKKGEIEAYLKGIPYEVVSDQVYMSMSDTQTPQGVMAVVKQDHYDLETLLKADAPLFLIAENLQDPGNLGTIMRTAEGAGATAVILSSSSVDLYNPKTIRSTMGSIFRVPFLYVDDLKDLLRTLKAHGVTSYAAHLKGTKNYDEFSYEKGCAFLIGNEGNGLTDELSEAADEYLLIPMEGKLESLNAAVSAAILMYEVHRQRK